MHVQERLSWRGRAAAAAAAGEGRRYAEWASQAGGTRYPLLEELAHLVGAAAMFPRLGCMRGV